MKKLGEKIIFIQDDAPHLLFSENLFGWNEELLHEMLDIDISTVFSDGGRLNYFCSFLLKIYIGRLLGKDRIQLQLKSILRSALTSFGQSLTQHKTRFQEIVALVYSNTRFTIDATRWSETLMEFLQCQTEVFLLPKELDSSDSPSNAKLTINDAVILFRKIDELVQNREGINECISLSSQILENMPIGLLPEVFGQVQLEKIIEAFDCRQNRRNLFSVEELMICQKRGLLFLFSQGTTDEQRANVATQLQKSIREKVLVINTKIAKFVFNTDPHELVPCDAKGCLKALGKFSLSFNGLEQRIELIKHLVGTPLNKDKEMVQGMRYLLHGQKDYFHNNQPLWTRAFKENAVWERMWKHLPENKEGDWNLLERSLIEYIPQGSWEVLGIREINPQKILERFQEVGFGQIKGEFFSAEERENVLIEAANNKNLWLKIPFHQTLAGQFTAIPEQYVFLQSSLEVPIELQNSITIIRLSEDERIRANQQKYIATLNEESFLRILLETEQPHRYWKEILDTLQQKSIDWNHRDIYKLLQEKCWLIDNKGRAIPPSDVIHLPEIKEEAYRLSTEIGRAYITPELLYNGICQHLYWNKLVNTFFATKENGLEKLGLLLEESSKYAIGKVRYKDKTSFKTLVDIFSEIPIQLDLPGWSVLFIVESAYGIEQCEEYILPNILKPLSLDKIVLLLGWLKEKSDTSDESTKKKLSDAYDCYLEVFVGMSECQSRLRDINLLNEAKQWRNATELCAYAEGIIREDLLNEQHKKILGAVIQSAGHTENNENEGSPFFYEDETVEHLKKFFTPWESIVPSNLIRAFLSLLGDNKEVLHLAESYEGNRSIKWIRDQLPWLIDTKREGDGKIGEFYKLNQHEAIQKHRFLVNLVTSQTIQVKSICGNKIDVRLSNKSEDFESLIVGGLDYQHSRDNLTFPKIRLRQIQVETFSLEQLSTLLRKTSEYLLLYAYNQKENNLVDLWSKLGEGEQLDIHIAQHLIKKHIPYYLKQLHIHPHEKLKNLIKNWDDARYRITEFEGNLERKLEFEAQENKALEDIQNLLVYDSEVQRTILEAVRSKMRDFQYSPASILFELFQNADDAVVELNEIRSYPNQPNLMNEINLPRSTYRFVLRKSSKSLSVLHWGRAVNYTGGSGFQGRERGFHKDLEKMLILSSSDKTAGENSVTGKFGLGFKSTSLISDVPKIISGYLQTEILGGMYPKRGENMQGLLEILKEETSERVTGTLIHLPIDVDIALEGICSLFEKMAKYLVVFAKQIRKLEIKEHDEHKNYEWAPAIICKTDDGQVEYGNIGLISTDSEKSTVLYFRFGGRGLLVGIGPQGLQALSSDIPAIWVVAPTYEDTGIGFAINGGFEVDAGRTRLSSNDDSTIEESQRMGALLGKIFLTLFDKSSNNWNQFKEQLRLGEEVQLYDFWKSFWFVFTRVWEQKRDEKIEKIVTSLLTEKNGIGRLVRERKALPNGLWDQFQNMNCVDDIQYVLRGSLSEEHVFKQIATLKIFSDIKPLRLISYPVFEALRKISPNFLEDKGHQWQFLELRTLLGWLSTNDYQIDSETASTLGRVIHSNFMEKIRLGNTDQQKETQEISGVLRKMKFRTIANEWQTANCLLVLQKTEDIREDELLRAAFAPKHLVLSENYEVNGIAFFKVCREKMEAPVGNMTSWVLEAETISTRSAALSYLLRGELGDKLSSQLREEGLKKSWLNELKPTSEVFHEWCEKDIFEILYRKLPPIESLFELYSHSSEYNPFLSTQKDPKYVLQKIYEWWSENKNQYLKKYERDTYPKEELPDLSENEQNDFNRSNWLLLFLLGAFHTLPWRLKQHKGFIKLCQQKGWWTTFSAKPSESQAENWMQVLDEYFDPQIDESEYEMCMNRFPSIYRIARHLDDYREAFLTIDRNPNFKNLEHITLPRINPDFQGGGISAPPIKKMLGIGACFIVRELKRANILTSKEVIPHCYVPVARVRRLLLKLGCFELEENEAYPRQSNIIYTFLHKHLGEKAEFQNTYDIPLQIIAENTELQQKFLDEILFEEDNIA